MKSSLLNNMSRVTVLAIIGRKITAYIDPNTGGMLFQFLAAGFTAISGFVLLFGRRIKMWWAGKRRARREKAGIVETTTHTEETPIVQTHEPS